MGSNGAIGMVSLLDIRAFPAHFSFTHGGDLLRICHFQTTRIRAGLPDRRVYAGVVNWGDDTSHSRQGV